MGASDTSLTWVTLNTSLHPQISNQLPILWSEMQPLELFIIVSRIVRFNLSLTSWFPKSDKHHASSSRLLILLEWWKAWKPYHWEPYMGLKKAMIYSLMVSAQSTVCFPFYQIYTLLLWWFLAIDGPVTQLVIDNVADRIIPCGLHTLNNPDFPHERLEWGFNDRSLRFYSDSRVRDLDLTCFLDAD